jgi:hypothetical protein
MKGWPNGAVYSRKLLLVALVITFRRDKQHSSGTPEPCDDRSDHTIVEVKRSNEAQGIRGGVGRARLKPETAAIDPINDTSIDVTDQQKSLWARSKRRVVHRDRQRFAIRSCQSRRDAEPAYRLFRRQRMLNKHQLRIRLTIQENISPGIDR